MYLNFTCRLHKHVTPQLVVSVIVVTNVYPVRRTITDSPFPLQKLNPQLPSGPCPLAKIMILQQHRRLHQRRRQRRQRKHHQQRRQYISSVCHNAIRVSIPSCPFSRPSPNVFPV